MRTTHKAAGLAAVAVLLAGAGTVRAAAAGQAAPASAAADGPALTVDATTGRHAIDPHIYGINFPDEALARELRLPVGRWGGNATSRYNYTNDSYNAGSDWYFEDLHYDNDVSALPAGSQADKFVEQNLRTGTDTLMTVAMTGWLTEAGG